MNMRILDKIMQKNVRRHCLNLKSNYTILLVQSRPIQINRDTD
jgi:hypothetical protein